MMFLAAVFGFICGAGAMAAFSKLLRLSFEAKRELQNDYITRLTDRSWSLRYIKAHDRWWVTDSDGNVFGTAIHWQRAAQIALDEYKPPAPCENCKGMPDAVAGKPFATCARCKRACVWPSVTGGFVPDRRPTDPHSYWRRSRDESGLCGICGRPEADHRLM